MPGRWQTNRRPGLRLVVLIVAVAVVAGTLITIALQGDESSPPRLEDGALATATPEDDRSPMPLPTATPPVVEAAGVAGLAYPIEGACLPESDLLMPGAPRTYRNGIHEGIDMYNVDSCTAISRGTEVLAAKAGTVIRADWDYRELTAETAAQLAEGIERTGDADAETLDILRGRQVWIDHGAGLVTRYAHLGGIADGIVVGESVEQGQAIAYVGESGTLDSIEAPGSELHLHFEIRVGEGYLGEGLGAADVRQLYRQVFSP